MTVAKAPTRAESLRKLIHAAFHILDDSETNVQTEVISIDNEIAADDLKEMAEALTELGIESHEDADELSDNYDALVAALADARMRFTNLADGIYHGIGHKNEPVTWLREAQEGRDAIDAALKAAKAQT